MKDKLQFPARTRLILANPALLSVCFLICGCYTFNQGVTFIGYLSRAVPLEKADVPPEFINLVHDIRYFAINELGLSDSKNYTRYVELDRDYLAAIVSASAKDSFHRHEWKFPVVGAMPYKGFFDIEDARKEREKLEQNNLDVWIRTVDGFSTLGWFSDPLYSYMVHYSAGRLANLIIHELVHSTVFIKGEITFNEELAEFIGSEGARLYMESRFGIDSEEYQAISSTDEDNKHFVAFIRELIAELQALYESSIGREEILIEKDRIIREAQQRFDDEYDSRFTSENYRSFSTLPINNAYLELFRLYYAEDDYIAGLYEKSGTTLPEFIAAAKSMHTRRGPPGRERLARALDI